MNEKIRKATSERLLDEIFVFANEKDSWSWSRRLEKISKLAHRLGYGFYNELMFLSDQDPPPIRNRHEGATLRLLQSSRASRRNLVNFLKNVESGDRVVFEYPIKDMLFQQNADATEPAVKISFGDGSQHDLLSMTLILMFFQGVKGVRQCPMCSTLYPIRKRDKKTCSDRCRTRLSQSKKSKMEIEARNKKRRDQYKYEKLNGGKK